MTDEAAVNTNQNNKTDEATIEATLKNKRILFVDDRPSTLRPFKAILEPYGVEVKQRKTLRGAMEMMAENPDEPFDLVLIDLNSPPIPEKLAPYRQKFRRLDLNHGQVLGIWLSDKDSDAPYRPRYAYLSAFPAELDRKADPTQENAQLIYKNFPVQDFPGRLCRLLKAA